VPFMHGSMPAEASACRHAAVSVGVTRLGPQLRQIQMRIDFIP
jgi:hypothetical protein